MNTKKTVTRITRLVNQIAAPHPRTSIKRQTRAIVDLTNKAVSLIDDLANDVIDQLRKTPK